MWSEKKKRYSRDGDMTWHMRSCDERCSRKDSHWIWTVLHNFLRVSEYAKPDALNDEQHWAKRLGDLHKMKPAHIMTEWFVPLKDTHPIARWLVFSLYVTGFLVVAIPALDTFAIVIITLFRG